MKAGRRERAGIRTQRKLKMLHQSHLGWRQARDLLADFADSEERDTVAEIVKKLRGTGDERRNSWTCAAFHLFADELERELERELKEAENG